MSSNSKAKGAEAKSKAQKDNRIKVVEKRFVGAIAELPVFEYNPDKTNTAIFRRDEQALENYIITEYGENGYFIRTGVEHVFARPMQPTAEEAAGPDAEFFQQNYREEVKHYVSAKNKYNHNKPKVYHTIWGQCAIAMTHKVAENAGYEVFHREKDPLALWLVIKQASLHGREVGSATKRMTDAKDNLARLHQGQSESVGDFYERFRHEWSATKDAGVKYGVEVERGTLTDVAYAARVAAAEDEEAAMIFIKKLDKRRFEPFWRELKNAYDLGRDEYPKTLQRAYTIAQSRREAGLHVVTVSEDAKTAVAYATYGKAGTGGKPKADDSGEHNPHAHLECHKCHQNGHIGRNCPLWLAAIEAVKKGDLATDSKPSVSDATSKKKKKKDKKAGHVTIGAEEAEHVGYCTMCEAAEKGECEKISGSVAAVANSKILDEDDYLCDNEANIRIVHSAKNLRNIRKASKPVKISGISGAVVATQVGDLWLKNVFIGEAYYHPESIANILCWYDLVERFKQASFDFKNNCFRVVLTPTKKKLVFQAKHKLYVYSDKDVNEATAMVQTVDNLKQQFTKREVEQAKLATEVSRRLGNPSEKDLNYAITHRLIKDCPITVRDVARAKTIFGPSLAVVKGATVRKAPEEAKIEPVDRSVVLKDKVILCIDIIWVSGLTFMLSVSRRLNLIMVRYIASRGVAALKAAVEAIISAYKAAQFQVQSLIFDGEGALVALQTWIQEQGITINPTAKNEHVPEVERAARHVKEKVRGFWNTLPFMLTSIMIIYLVYYCVMTINMFSKTSMVGAGFTTPRELFTGRVLDYGKDMKLGIFDYVQVHEDDMVTNTMKSRTVGCLSLGPTGNVQGGYKFLSLTSWKVITRKSWTPMPMPAEVIGVVNAHALEERRKGGLLVDMTLMFKLGDHDLPDNVAVDNDNVDESEDALGIAGVDDGQDDGSHHDEPDMMTPPDETDADVLPVTEPDPGPDGTVHGHEDTVNDHGHTVHGQNVFDEVEAAEIDPPPDDDVDIPGVVQTPAEALEELQQSSRYNLRSNRSSWKKYGETFTSVAFTNYSVKRGVKDIGLEAVIAMMKEMLQMHKKKVFHPVHFKGLSKTQLKKTIRSLMFLKRKRDGRLKARFCADGRNEFRYPGQDVSSPTVSIEAIFLTLAIEALERRIVATVDVEGAFLHCDMPIEIIMEIDPQLASMLADLEPETYANFIEHNGKMYVILDKALYGCIESAKLFYEHISKTLMNFGFVRNPYDVCVFNKMFEGKQITVTIHVDDLKISCADPRGVEAVIDELTRVYQKVNVCRDKVLDYLGMEFNYNEAGLVKISMKSMIEEMLDELGVEGTVNTPAAHNLFNVGQKSELLNKAGRERFHSLVAKLLYIAKRGRPDILVAVSFLTTRVQAPTQEDENKLMRVLKYLNGTRELVLRLSSVEGILVSTFIDAAFAVHGDGKGHTGQIILIGKGAVYFRSSKQKLVAKSSTEAELIAISDGLLQVIWTRNFLEAQGYKMDPATLHQDNKSTIILAEKGRSVSGRTRHVSVRYFFVKDRIDSNEVRIVHTGTEDMVADFFTKPLMGALFKKHRAMILNMQHEGPTLESSQGCVERCDVAEL